MFKNLFKSKIIDFHKQNKKNYDDYTTLSILNYKVFSFHKAGDNDTTSLFLLGLNYKYLFAFVYEPYFWNCRLLWNILFIGFGHERLKHPFTEFNISLAYFPYHYIELHSYIQFNPKSWFNIYFNMKRSHAEIGFRLFGTDIWLTLGRYDNDSDVKDIKRLSWCCDYCKIHCYVQDSHTDKLYKYGEFYKDKGVILYHDKAMTKIVHYSKSRAKKYKEFYTSTKVKIYTLDWLNCLYGRIIEFALPKLYYIAFSFEKPFWKRKWFGLDIDLNCDDHYDKDHIFKIKLILFKFEFMVKFDKNSINREANLFSCSTIDRYFALKGNKNNPKDNFVEAYEYLVNKHKTAQFKCLMKYVSPKKYIKTSDFGDYAYTYTFNRAMFDMIFPLLEEYKTLGQHFEEEDLNRKDWDNTDIVVSYAKEKLRQLNEKLKTARKKRRRKQ